MQFPRFGMHRPKLGMQFSRFRMLLPRFCMQIPITGTKPEDSGFPDKRWLSLDEMCETLELAIIEQKVEEYEAASKAARLAKLAPPLPASLDA